MAKIEKTQTEVTLSSETKRYLRNLTSALEKVARGMAIYQPQETKDRPKRLSEPAEDKPNGRIELDDAAISQLREVSQKSVHLGEYNALR